MVWSALGDMLPSALAVALSPFPVIAVVLVLATPQARSNGTAFGLGWLVGLSVLVALVFSFIGANNDSESTTGALLTWFRIIAGLWMIGAAVQKWRNRPRRGDEPVLPGWMARLDGIDPLNSFFIGAALGGANPKNFALTASATGSIAQAGLHGTQAWMAALGFVVLGSVTVVGAVVMKLVGGERATKPLESIKQFMLENNTVIMMIVLLLLGSKIAGDGLADLTA